MDFYINTIEDMQKEKDFFYHCKKFEFNHDFEKIFRKIDDALLEYEVLDSDVYLCEKDYFFISNLQY